MLVILEKLSTCLAVDWLEKIVLSINHNILMDLKTIILMHIYNKQSTKILRIIMEDGIIIINLYQTISKPSTMNP
mgnify:CR=1 FL=1